MEGKQTTGVYTMEGTVMLPDLTGQTFVHEKDRHGQSVMYQMFEGLRTSNYFPLSCLQEIRTFKLRPDDIYFPGYLRTGNHWTWEMTQMLLQGKAETVPRFKDHLELIPVEELVKHPSPRVLTCHFFMSQAPLDLKEKKCRVIYTMRDPKDVAVSLYKIHYDRHHLNTVYHGTFEDFLQLFLEHRVINNGIFDHLRDAEAYFNENPDIPVHFKLYEDSIKDPVQAVQKLSDFLGLPRNDDLCRAIAEKCHMSRMRVDKDAYAVKVDGDSLFFWKGVSGEWRNWFTEEMLEDYYRVYEEKMAGSRFYERYSRANDN
ncbi:sulfotransferase 1B1-like [Haliotis rufescens]|uniref:sulfotransferase 1B1-like n=1 Tax=Haliotis rufescens TaxID=6454 RepID=UPI00201F0765|nr:sulfotransferase 1B1-like [Haliotis rufescens]